MSQNQKKLVVVTGASSGIGRAIAGAFAESGHPVATLDRSGRVPEGLKGEILALRADVTRLDEVRGAIGDAVGKYGEVDCLVNNAGVMLLGQLPAQSPEEWRRMLDVNVVGVLNGIQSVLAGMIERRGGTLVNVSSIAGRKTFPNHAVYCATKFAVHALTENLREEVAKHGVRCITIAPGVVETKLLSHTSSDEIKGSYEAWKKTMGGGLAPEDVARVVLFAYQQPQHVCLREILIAPTSQEP
jgi:NADP-dependent 3-hydroxy acid dehydrogenase YdfG